MRPWKTTTAALAATLLLCGLASAQTPAPSPAPAEQQDLSITANVTARELLFRKVPNTRVEFTGAPERKTVWEADRENLPEEVRPGVTYRDIGVRLRITSVFADIERIVAEALGEVPAAEDATTPRQPDPTPPQPSPARPPAASQNPNAPAPQASPANAPAAEAPTRAARRARARRGNRR